MIVSNMSVVAYLRLVSSDALNSDSSFAWFMMKKQEVYEMFEKILEWLPLLENFFKWCSQCQLHSSTAIQRKWIKKWKSKKSKKITNQLQTQPRGQPEGKDICGARSSKSAHLKRWSFHSGPSLRIFLLRPKRVLRVLMDVGEIKVTRINVITVQWLTRRYVTNTPFRMFYSYLKNILYIKDEAISRQSD